jgi:membrane fusion protein, multidrug efflux system
MYKNSMRALNLASLLGTALAMGACTTSTVQTAPMVAVPVRVATAVEKTVPLELTAIGSADAFSTVSIKAQVNAVLDAVHIKEGQLVNKGDLLFTLDARPFQAALAQAQAQLARDQAQDELTTVEVHRYEQLYQAGVAAKEQYDQIAANANAQHAAVRADKAAVDAAQLQVDYCKIYAPLAGRTGALQVYPGNIVKQNDLPILIVINQVSPIYIDFSIPEQYLGSVDKFMKQGKLRVEATPYGDAQMETGTLTFIDNSVDNTTGTIKLKGTFDNADHRLWPGQFSTVALRLAEDEKATVVPSQAVQTGQNNDFIYVVKSDSTVEQRTVKVARTSGGESIISTGIKPGETVVTDGQLQLLPGIKVQVQQTSPPPAGN